MAFDAKGNNVMLDALGAVAVRVSLHTADPGAADTATGEVTGGTYARGTIAWNAAAASSMAAGTLPTIDVPSGHTVTWVALWNSAGTSRYLKKQLAAPEAFGADGTLEITAATLSLS